MVRGVLSERQARRLALTAQGLHARSPFGRGPRATLGAIRQLGYVQIDTISVLERAHHQVLWTRCPDYRPEILDQLQTGERKIFEYWSHAAAYLPLEDFRYCLPRMNAYRRGRRYWTAGYEPDRKLVGRVFDRVRSEGPLQGRDFAGGKRQQPKAEGWSSSEVRRALQQLFIEGRILVTRRIGFRREFDIPERVLPGHVDTTVPTAREFSRYLIRSALRSQGVVGESEIGYLRKGAGRGIRSELKTLCGEGEATEVTVRGQPCYASPESLQRLPARVGRRVTLLSPFDNLVIQRKRLRWLFDFDYAVECYLPPARRRWGYYCLPILWGDRLVGRLDPKADRKKGVLNVGRLFFEPGFADFDRLLPALAARLREVAAFCGASRVVVGTARPARVRKELQRLLKH